MGMSSSYKRGMSVGQLSVQPERKDLQQDLDRRYKVDA